MTTDTLDSRALRLTDCYGQRFMKAGTFRYGIFTVDGDLIADDRPFIVRVAERSAHTTMTQKTIVVRSEGGAS